MPLDPTCLPLVKLRPDEASLLAQAAAPPLQPGLDLASDLRCGGASHADDSLQIEPNTNLDPTCN